MAHLEENNKFILSQPSNYLNAITNLIPSMIIIDREINKILEICRPDNIGKYLITENTLVDVIKAYILSYYSLEPMDIVGRHRKQHKVFARQLICKFCKEYTKLTLTQIGFHIGDKDHSTVLHAIKTVNNAIDTKDGLADDYYNIKKEMNPVIKLLQINFLTKTVKLLDKIQNERSHTNK